MMPFYELNFSSKGHKFESIEVHRPNFLCSWKKPLIAASRFRHFGEKFGWHTVNHYVPKFASSQVQPATS
jgi:hypothetical protein